MDWFRNINIQSKLLVAFGTLIVMITLLSVFTVYKFNKTVESYDNLVDGPLKRLTDVKQASEELLKLRRYVISIGFKINNQTIDNDTAETDYADFQDSVTKFLKHLDSYINNINNDPLLAYSEKIQRIEIVDSITELFESDYLPHSETVFLATIDYDEATIAESILYLINVGDDISHLLDELSVIAQQSAESVRNNTVIASYNAKKQDIIITLGIVFLSFVVSFFMASNIKEPILNINVAMAEIMKGDLTFPIQNGYKDEIGELSSNIAHMIDQISLLNKSVTIVDNVEDLIYVTDMDYRIIYVNDKLAAERKIDKDQCINQKCHEVFWNRNKPCEYCPFPRMSPLKEQLPSSEWEHSYRSEKQLWYRCRSSIIYWVDGNYAFFTICINETLQKENEEMLRKAAFMAEEASMAKSSFLANMSHEIRTPMNGIIGFAELALDKNVSAEVVEDYLKKIKMSGQGLLQIINDILDISKIEAGKIDLEIIPFNLHEVFSICQTIIMPKALEKGIELFCYAEPSVGRLLLGDPTRLRQVLLNLLSNAIKFTNNGIVKLMCDITHETEDSLTLHFEIKDSGIGMTPEQLEKIFSPFTQADNSTTRQYGGTGLGLTISKDIIALMGGDLQVESIVDIGSKFSFDLVFKLADASTELPSFDIGIDVNESKKPNFQGNILLFEDNAINQQVIGDHLTRVGLKTVVAENGKVGVDLVKHRMDNNEEPFDLIFMDMHMPVMDGLEAVDFLKAMDNKTPIVALTANVMNTDKEIYRSHGINHYLGKPFTTKELWQCLYRYFTPISHETLNSHEQNDADAKRMKRLHKDFVKYNKTTVQDIKSAVNAGDIKQAHRMAHTLKGLAGLMEKTRLQEAARVIEIALAKGTASFTPEQMNALETEMDAVLRELSLLLASAKPPTLPQQKEENINRAEALALLNDLEIMLQSNNSKSLRRIDKLQAIPGTESLIEQIEDYDFELALETLIGIKQKWEEQP